MKLVPALFSTIILLSMAVATNSQSPTERIRSVPIGIGDVAPDFMLADQSQHKVTLADARGKSPVVLVFYRGYW